MNELATHTSGLPNSIQDLSKFVLVGREKLTSVRAEIRAIDRLNLAEEVRNQKKEEAQMLSEALLDAEVKIGDLLKQIPKSVGGRPEKTTDTAVHSFEENRGSKTPTQEQKVQAKTKTAIITELGFNEKQKSKKGGQIK